MNYFINTTACELATDKPICEWNAKEGVITN